MATRALILFESNTPGDGLLYVQAAWRLGFHPRALSADPAQYTTLRGTPPRRSVLIRIVAPMSDLAAGVAWHREPRPPDLGFPLCPSKLMPLAVTAFRSSNTGCGIGRSMNLPCSSAEASPSGFLTRRLPAAGPNPAGHKPLTDHPATINGGAERYGGDRADSARPVSPKLSAAWR